MIFGQTVCSVGSGYMKMVTQTKIMDILIIMIFYLALTIVTMCNMQRLDKLGIGTLNTRGIMSNAMHVDQLTNECDIMCIQEHHYSDMHGFIETLQRSTDCFIRSDHRLDINDQPQIRKGGIAIWWHKDISHAASPVYKLGDDGVMVIKVINLKLRSWRVWRHW